MHRSASLGFNRPDGPASCSTLSQLAHDAWARASCVQRSIGLLGWLSAEKLASDYRQTIMGFRCVCAHLIWPHLGGPSAHAGRKADTDSALKIPLQSWAGLPDEKDTSA